jgi:hypothetical protein
MDRHTTKKMTDKITSDVRFARWPELTLTLTYPPHSPMEVLEIRTNLAPEGGEVQIAAYGILAKANVDISEAKYMRAWRKVVELGGLHLEDDMKRKEREDAPSARIEVKWEHGKNRFGGNDLSQADPYKSIVRAIEALAGAALKKVQAHAKKHDPWVK